MSTRFRDLVRLATGMAIGSIAQDPFFAATERPPEEISAVAEERGFDFLPVRRPGHPVETWIAAVDVVKVGPRWEYLAEWEHPLSPANLCGRDASIFEVLPRLLEKRQLLTLGERGVDRIVSLWDLDRAQIWAIAFGLVTAIEVELGDDLRRTSIDVAQLPAISARLPDVLDVNASGLRVGYHLSRPTELKPRGNLVRAATEYERARRRDEHLDFVSSLYLSTKAHLVLAGAVPEFVERVGAPTEDVASLLYIFNEYRNDLAHDRRANVASPPERARLLRELHRWLLLLTGEVGAAPSHGMHSGEG